MAARRGSCVRMRGAVRGSRRNCVRCALSRTWKTARGTGRRSTAAMGEERRENRPQQQQALKSPHLSKGGAVCNTENR